MMTDKKNLADIDDDIYCKLLSSFSVCLYTGFRYAKD